MFVREFQKSQKNVAKLLATVPDAPRGDLMHLVEMVRRKSAAIKKIVATHPTPFYVFDRGTTEEAIKKFTTPFKEQIKGIKFYFAVKTNYHPLLLKTVVDHGMGLDVSSARELLLGVSSGAKEMLFSGPGKNEQELVIFLKHRKRSTLIIDSFDELDRIGRITNNQKVTVRAGVRFFSSFHGEWSKFGIPLNEVKRFWQRAQWYPFLNLEGLQFHISLNRTPKRYIDIIKELSAYLKTNCSAAMRKQIHFIDFGGGYYPDNVEGFYPWAERYPWMLSGGYLMKVADEAVGEHTQFGDNYYITHADAPEVFAREIAAAIQTHLNPLVQSQYYCEPGRIIAHSSMHIVASIVDRKPGMVITDGGNNLVGWEAGNQFYYPIVNITHPSKTETPIRVYGSLCNPKDLWGYYSYSKKFDQGDVLVIPFQGAYRYTLAQNFIRPVPPVYALE